MRLVDFYPYWDVVEVQDAGSGERTLAFDVLQQLVCADAQRVHGPPAACGIILPPRQRPPQAKVKQTRQRVLRQLGHRHQHLCRFQYQAVVSQALMRRQCQAKAEKTQAVENLTQRPQRR